MSYKTRRVVERTTLVQLAGKILATTPNKTVEDVVSMARHLENYVFEEITVTDDRIKSIQERAYDDVQWDAVEQAPQAIMPGRPQYIYNEPGLGIGQGQNAAPNQPMNPGRGF